MGFLKRLLGGVMSGNHGGGHHGSSYRPNSNYENQITRRKGEASSCPKCKAGNPYNSKFCQQCGASLSATLTCIQCNSGLLPDAKFCPQCGKPRA